jgi:hypothetical protein
VEISLLIGVIGGLMVLIAFISSSLGKLSRFTYRYMALNGIGATLLIYYAIMSKSIIFIFLNIIWVSVEIYYLIRKLLK